MTFSRIVTIGQINDLNYKATMGIDTNVLPDNPRRWPILLNSVAHPEHSTPFESF